MNGAGAFLGCRFWFWVWAAIEKSIRKMRHKFAEMSVEAEWDRVMVVGQCIRQRRENKTSPAVFVVVVDVRAAGRFETSHTGRFRRVVPYRGLYQGLPTLKQVSN